MIGLFTSLFERLVGVAVGLLGALIAGILGAPAAALANASARVRRASAEEVVDLRHVVLRAGRPRDTAVFAGDLAPSTRHWVVETRAGIVGVATVVDAPFPDGDGPRWQLRGMAIAPQLQGSGLGARLLQAVAADVAGPMWCNARTSAEGFYARRGWRAVSEPFDIEGVGPHVRMVTSHLPERR